MLFAVYRHTQDTRYCRGDLRCAMKAGSSDEPVWLEDGQHATMARFKYVPIFRLFSETFSSYVAMELEWSVWSWLLVQLDQKSAS